MGEDNKEGRSGMKKEIVVSIRKEKGTPFSIYEVLKIVAKNHECDDDIFYVIPGDTMKITTNITFID